MTPFNKLVLSLILIVGFSTSQAQITPEKIGGFSHPESVVMDPQSHILYISNIGNKTAGDGFISKMSSEGEIIELKWITGLNDPKGLLVKGEKLYVTDNTELVEMDIQQSEVSKRMTVEGAVSLNDITIDGQGNLYISDTGKSSIYRMDVKGEVSEWLTSEELEFPNGLLVVNEYIYVAAWGREESGNLLKVNLATKEISTISHHGIGNLDGIQRINDNSFYISDWATGTIYKIDTLGNTTEVLTSERSAGDILFLPGLSELIVPMNLQNEVWWYQLD